MIYLIVDRTQHKAESINLKTISEKYPGLSTKGKRRKKTEPGWGGRQKKPNILMMIRVPEEEERIG